MIISNHRATRDNVYDPVPTAAYLARVDRAPYYTGEYQIGLNLFSLHYNLMASAGGHAAPAVDLPNALRAAKDMGFDAVDITAYYLPGYDGHLPMRDPQESRLTMHDVLKHARGIRSLVQELDLAISGTGIRNDFATPDEADRAFDVSITKKWIDVAQTMGAPVMRVFSGLVPSDIDRLGWEAITRDRIVPALRECAEYAQSKRVKLGVQNHGDMLCTADQVIRTLRWVNHPSIGAVNDTAYFRRFNSFAGGDYAWMDDIEAVAPLSVNFQIKRKQAWPDGAPTDLDELFRRVRSGGYTGILPIEFVWDQTDQSHPVKLEEPPYDQMHAYLMEVRNAAERTSQP